MSDTEDRADLAPSAPVNALPGELAPLDPTTRPWGAPISDAEALGVARRHARIAASHGRRRTHLSLPDALPSPDAPPIMAAYRIPAHLIMKARAKAGDLEDTTVTRVIIDALQAYVSASPGAQVQYRAMTGGVHATAAGPTRSVPDVTRRSRRDAPDVGVD